MSEGHTKHNRNIIFYFTVVSYKELNSLDEMTIILSLFFSPTHTHKKRISVIFRVRSAKAIKITDASLIKKLSLLCGFVSVALLIRTLVSPPDVIVGRTADNLKAFLCKTDWWDHTFTSRKLIHKFSSLRFYYAAEFHIDFYPFSSLSFLFTVEVLFLAWGVRLCIVVRKAPSEFNESRFISMAIYNEFLLTCFLNVSM